MLRVFTILICINFVSIFINSLGIKCDFIAININERRQIFSNITTQLIEPSKIPQPMFNLETKLSYRGSGNNIPIPENIEYNKRLTEQLMDFLKILRLYARHYIQTGDIKSANKLYFYLDTWAKARAFLGKFDTMYLQWALGTVALTYDILPQKYTHIENWLLECVTKIRQGTKILFKNNNIGIWGAFSLMATGLVISHKSTIDFAYQRFLFYLRRINSNGSIADELHRQDLALNYHMFSLTPLLMMMHMSLRNNLTKHFHNNLHLLANFILRNLENPSEIERLTKQKQKINMWGMEWIELYYYMFPNRKDVLNFISKTRTNYWPNGNILYVGIDMITAYGIEPNKRIIT